MNPEIVLYAIGGVCAVIVGVIGLIKTKSSAESTANIDPSKEAWKVIGVLIERQETSEGRIDSLEKDLATERNHSRQQDTAIEKLERELARAVHHIWEFWKWIDAGAPPPPPARPPWLSRLPGWPSDEPPSGE